MLQKVSSSYEMSTITLLTKIIEGVSSVVVTNPATRSLGSVHPVVGCLNITIKCWWGEKSDSFLNFKVFVQSLKDYTCICTFKNVCDLFSSASR